MKEAAFQFGLDLLVGIRIGQGDGLVTRQRGLALSIFVADCLPIFLWDAKGSATGLLHAGWRGSAAGIVRSGVRIFIEIFGIQVQDLRALLGPSICGNCYEVGPEVAEHFESSDLHPGQGDRFYLDLKAANRRLLLEAGLNENSIHEDASCTHCRNDRFFSYRVEGTQAGRLIAVIGIKNYLI